MKEKIDLNYQNTQFEIDGYWLDDADNDALEEVNLSKKPLVIICPGGGFTYLSDFESQPVAMRYAAEGMHSLVFNYQLTDDENSTYPLAMQELAVTLNWVYDHAEEKNIDISKVVLLGFSAGGHVVANFNSYMMDKNLREVIFDQELKLEPAGIMLSYPVVDMGLGWPNDENLAKKIDPTEKFYQAQKNINSNSKPTYLWTTMTDSLVPAKNPLVYVDELDKNAIPYEVHAFGIG
ncbi:alpha/beta hydrolase [Lactobacillus terrae]|uniref:alpha/beta hydrolase n=1 Tax=Lactobacillus terrae TaxID=2269374 RepID=UPI0014735AA4|nr:alpha/beta hydrolase [Lactobacillus terrae]